MCPRAVAHHNGAAMPRTTATTSATHVHSFGEDEYIDLDLSSCGEFEFQMRRSSAMPCADDLFCKGRLVPLHKVAPRPSSARHQEVDTGGRRSAATVTPLLQQQHPGRLVNAQPGRPHAEGSRCKKAVKTVHSKLQASRSFLRSLFARAQFSDEQYHGIGIGIGTAVSSAGARSKAPFGPIKKGSNNNGAPFAQTKNSYNGSNRGAATTLKNSIEKEKLMDEEENAAGGHQRKSFSGAIKWRLMTAAAGAKPSSVATRSSGVPVLKRSSSASSEAEGLIQGAIAYCKRSQQQLALARKSVSDAGLCSFLA